MPKASISVRQLLRALDGVIAVRGDEVVVLDEAALSESAADRLVLDAVFGSGQVRTAARWLLRAAARAVGVYPASTHELYLAAGRYEYDRATTPAINVRGMTYDVARAILRAASRKETKQVIFELSYAEMGYTEQEPAEYVAVILAAALREGYRGPVFVQFDHLQIDAVRYQRDPAAELARLRRLIRDAIAAGFYNIDIDASTLVDLARPTLLEQQELNARHTAELTAHIRALQPPGITVSVGGEIGEVGARDSTTEDLDAFMAGYLPALRDEGEALPGISKISVATGTSHGGVVLPDGSHASVQLNLQALGDLSEHARRAYGLGGAVQHGASTLPEAAFNQLAERSAVEVHLATAFTTIVYEHLPADFSRELYAYLAEYHADERKPAMTDAQFAHATRKKAFGPFKEQFWALPADVKEAIAAALGARFDVLFGRLGVGGNAALVERHAPPVLAADPLPDALYTALVAAAPAAE